MKELRIYTRIWVCWILLFLKGLESMMNQSNDIELGPGSMLALQMASLDLIPGIPYVSFKLARNNSWVKSKHWEQPSVPLPQNWNRIILGRLPVPSTNGRSLNVAIFVLTSRKLNGKLNNSSWIHQEGKEDKTHAVQRMKRWANRSKSG